MESSPVAAVVRGGNQPLEPRRWKLSVGPGGVEKAAVVGAGIDAPCLCPLLGCFLASEFLLSLQDSLTCIC